MTAPRTVGTAGGDSPGSLHLLARRGMVTLSGLISNAVLSFALTVVISRGLHARGAGIVFQAVGLFNILTAVSQFGSGAGMVRWIPRLRALDRSQDLRGVLHVALWPVTAFASMLALALYLLAPWLAGILDLGSRGTGVLRLLAPFLPLGAATVVIVAGTRGFGSYLPYVVLENLAKPALRPALAGAAILLGLGPFGVAIGWALPVAITFPFALAAMLRLLDRSDRTVDFRQSQRRAFPTLLSEFWRFAAPRGLALTLQVSVVWLDVLLLGSLRGAREAGVYAAVGRLVTVGMMGIEAIRIAVEPHISTLLARDDREGAQELFRVGTWWLVAISWPLYLALANYAPVVLRIFGADFVAGQHALMIVSLAMLVSVGTGNVTVMLLMGGKSVWNLLNTAAALATNVALNLLLIPRYGMIGAALAWMCSIAVENLSALVQVRRLLGITPFGRGFFYVTAAGLLLYGGLGWAFRMLLGGTFGSLLAYLLVATAIYVWVLYRARELLHLAVLREVARGFVGGLRRVGTLGRGNGGIAPPR